jgi:hypothetical protein
LSVFLDSIANSGYTIFVVRSTKSLKLPQPNKSGQEDMAKDHQYYVTVSSIEQFHKNDKNKKLNVSGQAERELKKQLDEHLRKEGGGGGDDESAPMVGHVFNGK